MMISSLPLSIISISFSRFSICSPVRFGSISNFLRSASAALIPVKRFCTDSIFCRANHQDTVHRIDVEQWKNAHRIILQMRFSWRAAQLTVSSRQRFVPQRHMRGLIYKTSMDGAAQGATLPGGSFDQGSRTFWPKGEPFFEGSNTF